MKSNENPNHFTVFEYDTLRLTPPQYQAFQTYYGDKGVPYFNLINNGVRFCQFVGVLQIGNMTIEVLPKADKGNDKGKWKSLLIGMLREVGVFNVHAPSSSDLKLQNNSILDLYLELFINSSLRN